MARSGIHKKFHHSPAPAVDWRDYLNGMPCHRYMLRNLKNTDIDTLTFTFSFIDTMKGQGMPDKDIEAAVALFPLMVTSDSSLKERDFLNYNGRPEGLSLVNARSVDSLTPKKNNCSAYCRELLTNNKICQLCPKSQLYTNDLIMEELRLLGFSLRTRENFTFLKEQGLSENNFIGVWDFGQNYNGAREPLVEKVSNLLYKSINLSRFTGFGKSQLPDGFVKTIKKNIGRRTSVSLPTDSIISKEISLISDLVLAGFSMGTDEALELAGKLLSRQEKKESKQSAEAVYYGRMSKTGSASEIYGIKDLVSVDSNFEEITLSGVFERSAPDENCVEDVSVEGKDTIKEDVFDTFVDFNLAFGLDGLDNTAVKKEPEASSLLDEATLKEDTSTAQNRVGECLENKEPLEEPRLSGSVMDADENMEGDVNPSVEDAGFESRNSYSKEKMDNCASGEIVLRELPDIVSEVYPEKNNLAGIPLVKEQELKHFCINLDSASREVRVLFESYTLKNKTFCIEVVETEKKHRYFLIYSASLHAYFYTTLSNNETKEIITMLLRYKSVTKYCYSPFIVNGYLMQLGIYVKNLVSIYSLSAVHFGKHTYDYGTCMALLGARAAMGGVTVRPEGAIESPVLKYMYSYYYIYHRYIPLFVEKGMYLEFERRCSLDILLSRFYFQDKVIDGRRFLFSIQDSLRYRFFPIGITEVPSVTYNFIGFSLPAGYVSDLLCLLQEKGFFKKYPVWLLYLSSHSFTIHIKEGYEKEVDNVIHSTMSVDMYNKKIYGVICETI